MIPEEVLAKLKIFWQSSFQKSTIPCVTDASTREEIMLPSQDGTLLHTVITRPVFKHNEEVLPDGSSLQNEPAWMKQPDTECREMAQVALPTIVQRSCYPEQLPLYEICGEELAKRGFIHVMQYCRGTGKSQGEWQPNVNEREDGLSLLNWLNDQPWVESMVWWGTSYLALTGWVLADAVPSKMKGMVLNVYGTDRYSSAYEKGMFRHDILTGWAMQNAGRPVDADYLDSCRYRPQIEMDEALWGGKLSWYRDWISNEKLSDEYWQSGFWKMLREIPARTTVPVYVIDAWYDHHFSSAIHGWEALNPETKAHSWLTIGCWNHFGNNVLPWCRPEHLNNNEVALMLDFTKTVLLEKKVPTKQIRYYQIGGDSWQEAKVFPPKKEAIRSFCLTGAKELADSPDEGSDKDKALSFIFDPEHPVPSCGGEALLTSMNLAGSLPQPEPGWRDDVLTFLSPVLEKPLNIFGKIQVKLAVMTDAEDTAFTARLSQVLPDGKAYHMRSSITRILADQTDYQPGTKTTVQITMWDVSWQVPAGCRLRLDISSSDFPQYAVHSNYAGAWAIQKKVCKAKQTIFCGEDSVLELPLMV
ncbi:MAG: CocE/NonD family hydrolase [Clostridiales bacterium]|nr:CocE/NonD family hydrolase [Clostridiales bacterium]